MDPSITARSPSTALEVVELDLAQDPAWDVFVTGHPDGLVYHHSGWIRSLEGEYDQRAIALACRDANGTVHGVLPLMVTRGMPLGIGGPTAGPRLASLPRTPLAGPLASDDRAVRALVRAALERAESRRLILQLKVAERSLDGMDDRLTGSVWRSTYSRQLPSDPEQLRFGNSRNHARIRWAVGKAQREGLQVRAAESSDDLRGWYGLYLDVNRWRGQPSRPYRLFQAMWDLLRPIGLMRLLLVERSSSGGVQMVAGSVLLMLGETVFYAFNGRRREALSLRPNDLLQWHAMRDACEAGFRRYDFGEVETENSGLAGFKAKWGTETHSLYRYHAPPLTLAASGYGAVESRGRMHRAALAVWRRAPLGLTAIVGERLYRFL